MNAYPFLVTRAHNQNLGLPEIWKFEVATPLHIGSGEKLSRLAYDFRIVNGVLYYPDHSMLFENFKYENRAPVPSHKESCERDRLTGTPVWTHLNKRPETEITSFDSYSHLEPVSTETTVNSTLEKENIQSLEERISKASTSKEVCEILGLDKHSVFSQVFNQCNCDKDFEKKLLNRIDLARYVETPESYNKKEPFSQYCKQIKKPERKEESDDEGIVDTIKITGNIDDFNELHQFIRDGMGQPYIPGSSLKGVLRTFLFKHLGYGTNSQQRKKNTLTESGGMNPTGDLGRLIQVGDAPTQIENLGLFKISVVSKGEPTIPIFVEAILPGSMISSHLRIDSTLTKALEKGVLNNQNNPEQFWQQTHIASNGSLYCLNERIPELMRNYSKRIARYQVNGLQKRAQKSMSHEGRNILESVANWLNSNIINSNDCYMQIGFASGWSGMTGIPALFEDIASAERAANDIGNNPSFPYKKRLKNGSYGSQNPFPLSFRLVETLEGWRPMGWLKLIV